MGRRFDVSNRGAPTTMAHDEAMATLRALKLDRKRFLELLEKLIGISEKLQDNPPHFVPQENLAIQHVMAAVDPFRVENGGRLHVEHVVYSEGRGNLILKIPGTTEKVVSMVGSHLDVVVADPECWERDPFQLHVEGDKLFGRGTTDCLGHVALVTTLMTQLAESGVELDTTVCAVFIASEEAQAEAGVGVDGLLEDGKLVLMKKGPLLWLDTADSQPCIGTAGALTWDLKCNGMLCHSGMPQQGINAVELAMEATKYLQDVFYEQFPACDKEKEYYFRTPSTMKPTQISCAKGGLNQIPQWCLVQGDVRLTPFYTMEQVKKSLEEAVARLNEDPTCLPSHGPVSQYAVPGKKASLELSFGKYVMHGIACNLTPHYHALCSAIKQVRKECQPYSVSGSLPLVKEMQDAGFNIFMLGFGLMSSYHADNEFCLLSDMELGIEILANWIANCEGI